MSDVQIRRIGSASDAEQLYIRTGWQRNGLKPGYALLPHGGLCDTVCDDREPASVA